jgi:hypothetical protein
MVEVEALTAVTWQKRPPASVGKAVSLLAVLVATLPTAR